MTPWGPTGPRADGPLIYGHRGASRDATENTVEAFRLALAQGADGVELDVRPTNDGSLIVHHNARAEGGTTDLADLTLDEISTAHPYIPTLDEAWESLGATAYLNLEIKVDPGRGDRDAPRRLTDSVLTWIGDHEASSRLLVSSFDPETTRYVHAQAPQLATGQLSTGLIDAETALRGAASDGHLTANLPVAQVVQRPKHLIGIATDLGLGVVVWTLDDPAVAVDLAAAGVAAIITNVPAVLVAALR